ncbi:hypothetical protein SPLC1_S270080 [Arthrospira platensis C1]|nr:hypothetical protein SPLC1_S270080 [Arthrospira platensis C1]
MFDHQATLMVIELGAESLVNHGAIARLIRVQCVS